ncbi:MAG TPA: DUF1348 family protein [Candidatus Saccharimonadales bacterium]|nr:DUF1348 family protein [Candidatus Saccharimonadales bacterium]
MTRPCKVPLKFYCFRETLIAVSFEYEWHNEQGQWYRPYGNELWGGAESGLKIQESDRWVL